MLKKKNTTTLGSLGEDSVVKYIKKDKGWKVLARNFSKPWGELDIVARDRSTIIFIEVKALSINSAKYFKPEEHFDFRKQEKVARTAHSYLAENKYTEDTQYRIDLAAVEVDKERGIGKLRYYENVIA